MVSCRFSVVGTLLALSLASGVSSTSVAGDYDVRVYRNAAPSEEELIDALSVDEPISLRTRGIRPQTAMPKKAVSLDVIRFKFDSYQLTSEGREVLNTLGRALISERLKESRFLIEGHTDSVGNSDYNKRLSEKRAQSVKSYLTSSFDIDDRRLLTVGRGEDDLLNKDDPTSGENRRVQIVNLN